jgi:hypothetical protein
MKSDPENEDTIEVNHTSERENSIRACRAATKGTVEREIA